MPSGVLVLAFNSKIFTDTQNLLGRYCIPTSDDRPITKAEKTFFNECGTGHGRCHLIINILPQKMSL